MRFVTRLSPGIVAAALGALVLAALLYADRPIYGAVFHETQDLAANSLLVQDAKRLALVNGNYSRVGFNHPGPAILYVLAAGELVFHDVLGWVRSPVAGQVVAIAFYTAAWMAALAAVLARTFGSAGIGAAAAGTFLAVTLLRDPQYAVSAWFPYLYYMPFAVYTAAIGRLAAGSFDSLVALCVAGGFVVHGHAAFVPIVGIMAVGAIVAHARRSVRLRGGGWREYAGAVWRDERPVLLAAAAVLALFAAPILLDALLHFPGEFPKYFGYGRGSRGNAWGAVMAFLGYSWGGDGIAMLPALAGFAAIAALALSPAARGLALALALATLATALYAKTGIDDLIHKYTAYYYFAVVALAVAGFAALLLSWIEPFARPVPAAAALVALGLAAARMAPSDVMEPDPAIPAAVASLERLERRPAVLDLDMRHDWQHLWGFVVGMASREARAGRRPLCVNANWHILFTRRLQCTDADRAAGTRFVVTARPNALAGAEGGFEHSRVAFVPAGAPRLEPGVPLMFTEANGALAGSSLGEGWSAPEREFTWSTGPSSSLAVRVPGRGPFRLALEIGAFVPKAEHTQRVDVIVRGEPVARLDFSAERNFATRTIEVPAAGTGGGATVAIEFRVAEPRSPQSVGYSPDPRPLGVMLRSITLLPSPS
jgi:hypothetical protein